MLSYKNKIYSFNIDREGDGLAKDIGSLKKCLQHCSNTLPTHENIDALLIIDVFIKNSINIYAM